MATSEPIVAVLAELFVKVWETEAPPSVNVNAFDPPPNVTAAAPDAIVISLTRIENPVAVAVMPSVLVCVPRMLHVNPCVPAGPPKFELLRLSVSAGFPAVNPPKTAVSVAAGVLLGVPVGVQF